MNTYTKTLSVSKLQTLYFYGSWIAFLGILSQLYVPLWPVPITGQILAFLILGLFNTPKQTWSIALFYVLLGIMGLPLFHGFSGGIAFLSSPTFGYILGFPLLSVIVSSLKPLITGIYSFYIVSFLAIVPCFILGLLYLSVFLGFNFTLLYSGFLIFIPGEIIKISLAYYLYFRGKTQ